MTRKAFMLGALFFLLILTAGCLWFREKLEVIADDALSVIICDEFKNIGANPKGQICTNVLSEHVQRIPSEKIENLLPLVNANEFKERLKDEARQRGGLIHYSCDFEGERKWEHSFEDCRTKGQICYQEGVSSAQCIPKPVCGNNSVELGETCEVERTVLSKGSQREKPVLGLVGGITCQTLGYAFGTIACNNCQLDVSDCELFDVVAPPETQPIQEVCLSEYGLEGKTGENAVPLVRYDWRWGLAPCEFSQKASHVFCDATQFSQFLMNKIDIMNREETASSSVMIALMADGFSEDFRKDFDYYYRNIDFFGAPSAYKEELFQLMIDNEKLEFAPAKIEEPGIYNLEINQEGGKWTVSFNKVFNPEKDSTLYHWPINGEVGVNKRPDEQQASRQGYGFGLTGENLGLRVSSFLSPISSDQKNLVSTKKTSFEETNMISPGFLLHLDLEQGKLEQFPVKANPIMVKAKRNPEKQQPVFVVTNVEGTQNLELPSYKNWVLRQATNKCSALDPTELTETIEDAEFSGQCVDGTSPGYSHILMTPTEENDELNAAFYATVFYSGEDMVLSGRCGTEFFDQFSYTAEESSTYPSVSFFEGEVNLDDLLFDLSRQRVCIFDDPEKKQAIFFINKKRFLNRLPYCFECQCINPKFRTKILSVGVKPTPVFSNQSTTFWVQLEEQSPFSNEDIELFLGGKKVGVVFYDDGLHNDFFRNDGIFAATIVEGFPETGTSSFHIKLKDAFGNETQSEEVSFAVFPAQNCPALKLSGNPGEKMNIFFLNDNLEKEEFEGIANSAVEMFLDAKPISNVLQEKFNFYRIDTEFSLGCTKRTTEFPSPLGEVNIMDCPEERVFQLINSCSIPFKQTGRTKRDKAVVMGELVDKREENVFVHSSSQLSGSIARIADKSPNTAVHELGHTFGLLDYHFDFVLESQGVASCNEKKELRCIMCDKVKWSDFSCGLKYRDNCNLSVDHEDAFKPFNVCERGQEELDDEAYLKWFFSQMP